jgi:hypothetical protein
MRREDLIMCKKHLPSAALLIPVHSLLTVDNELALENCELFH